MLDHVIYSIIFLHVVILGTCPNVKVLHTDHWRYGDTGMYFFFSPTDLDAMLGRTNWNRETLDVTQKGSQEWSGKIKVFMGPMGAYGRRAYGVNGGQWKQNDIIELQTCNVAGKCVFIYSYQ